MKLYRHKVNSLSLSAKPHFHQSNCISKTVFNHYLGKHFRNLSLSQVFLFTDITLYYHACLLTDKDWGLKDVVCELAIWHVSWSFITFWSYFSLVLCNTIIINMCFKVCAGINYKYPCDPGQFWTCATDNDDKVRYGSFMWYWTLCCME